MKQVRVTKTSQRPKDERSEALPVDPRDLDVVRAKQRMYARGRKLRAA